MNLEQEAELPDGGPARQGPTHPASGRQLRIGIMCHGRQFPAWQSLVIEHLRDTQGIQIALLILDAGVVPPDAKQAEPATAGFRARVVSAYREGRLFSSMIRGLAVRSGLGIISNPHSLWDTYRRTARRFAPQPCDAIVDMGAKLTTVPQLRCRVSLVGKYSQYFSPADIREIADYRLDIIIRFSFNILRGDILHTPRLGVWSFHHDDHLKYRGGPEGFWEIYHNDEWSGAILQRLSDKLDDGTVICKDRFRTIKHSYSLNRNQLLMKTVRWPADACLAILNEEISDLRTHSSMSHAPIFKVPRNPAMVVFLLRLLWFKFANLWKHYFGKTFSGAERWSLGIFRSTYHALLPGPIEPEITWITPTEKSFFADPFLVSYKGDSYVFFEEYDYARRKGHIAYVRANDPGRVSEPRPAIRKPYHLSYPCVFQHDRHLYCVPEQHESRTIALYEAVDFPDEWREKCILVPNFAGLDPTVFLHEQTWWMFAANFENDDQSNLYLFHADDLEGPWHPHAKNPVRHSKKKTRPAGNVFSANGKLIRPSQNCTHTYGGSIILNEIVTLTTQDFQERVFREIKPRETWRHSSGLHTLSTIGSVTVIDAKYHAPIWFVPFRNAFRAVPLLFAALKFKLAQAMSGPGGPPTRSSNT